MGSKSSYFTDKKSIKTISLKIHFWGKYEESIKWFQLKLLTCYRLTIILKIVFAKSFNIGQK
jgi:hypothetical protein